MVPGDPPALYLSLLDQLDPSTLNEVSLSSVHRLLTTSKLPAATIEKVLVPTLSSLLKLLTLHRSST